jgi:hypothetical protein
VVAVDKHGVIRQTRTLAITMSEVEDPQQELFEIRDNAKTDCETCSESATWIGKDG